MSALSRPASASRRQGCLPPHDIRRAINTAVYSEIRPSAMATHQSLLPLATEGVLRYVWESKFGPMLIEVVGDEIFVNGMAVEPAPR